jgi:hypothetical protein
VAHSPTAPTAPTDGCASGRPPHRGGDEVLGIVSGLDGYDGYLIRADGGEASTPGITFAAA